jgi:hypothetical protein
MMWMGHSVNADCKSDSNLCVYLSQRPAVPALAIPLRQRMPGPAIAGEAHRLALAEIATSFGITRLGR